MVDAPEQRLLQPARAHALPQHLRGERAQYMRSVNMIRNGQVYSALNELRMQQARLQGRQPDVSHRDSATSSRKHSLPPQMLWTPT